MERPGPRFCVGIQWHPEVGRDHGAVRGAGRRSDRPAGRRHGRVGLIHLGASSPETTSAGAETTSPGQVTVRRMLALATSAFLVLAAEPLYLLVDTAVVGHLGAAALGALGIGTTLMGLARDRRHLRRVRHDVPGRPVVR